MNEMESIAIQGPSNFSFSATKIDSLESTEYTLATIVIDTSGSVFSFKDDLLLMLKTIIKACKKSPRAENLLIRVLEFSDNLNEIHGFKLLNSIDIDNDYTSFSIGGCTALCDATYSAIGAELTYADNLIKQGFTVNGCVYIITDGEENASSTNIKEIKKQSIEAMKQEKIESLLTILIGLTSDNQISTSLENFKKDAMISGYIGAGDATPSKLAKISAFVATSISSSSQCLGTGKQANQSLQL